MTLLDLLKEGNLFVRKLTAGQELKRFLIRARYSLRRSLRIYSNASLPRGTQVTIALFTGTGTRLAAACVSIREVYAAIHSVCYSVNCRGMLAVSARIFVSYLSLSYENVSSVDIVFRHVA